MRVLQEEDVSKIAAPQDMDDLTAAFFFYERTIRRIAAPRNNATESFCQRPQSPRLTASLLDDSLGHMKRLRYGKPLSVRIDGTTTGVCCSCFSVRQ